MTDYHNQLSALPSQQDVFLPHNWADKPMVGFLERFIKRTAPKPRIREVNLGKCIEPIQASNKAWQKKKRRTIWAVLCAVVLVIAFATAWAIQSTQVLRVQQVGAFTRGHFHQLEGRELGLPGETSIEFVFGVPEDVAQSPYPEKLVLAFYLALGRNNPLAQTYLSESSGLKNVVGSSNFGTAASGDQIQKVLVKRIIYTPGREKEERHEPVRVTVCVVSVTSEGEDPPRDVMWEVVWEPAREGVVKSGWKLHRIIPP